MTAQRMAWHWIGALFGIILAFPILVFAETSGEKPVIGLQLYSLRNQMAKDVPGTLKLAKQMGFTDVEGGAPSGMTSEQFRKLLDDNGLKASGTGAAYPQFLTQMDQVIANAKALGAQQVMCAWIPHKGKFTAADAHIAAANFNKFGAALKNAGLRFAYHAHGYEFAPGPDGVMPFDILAAETDPAFVTFELDVFWAFHGGQDPAKLMQKYPTRFEALHLKDMKPGTPVRLTTGQAPKDSDVTIGTGLLDFPAIMKEARTIGVKHYYIEDESSISVEQIPQSLKYLNALSQ